jgi:hypothetical protein
LPLDRGSSRVRPSLIETACWDRQSWFTKLDVAETR